MTMENVVRPFATNWVNPPVVGRKNNAGNPDEIEMTIEFGGANTVETSYNNTSTIQSVRRTENTEHRRKFDKVRVKNQDDPETYIDVEVTKAIAQSAAKGANINAPSQNVIKLIEQEEDDHIEILERDQIKTG